MNRPNQLFCRKLSGNDLKFGTDELKIDFSKRVSLEVALSKISLDFPFNPVRVYHFLRHLLTSCKKRSTRVPSILHSIDFLGVFLRANDLYCVFEGLFKSVLRRAIFSNSTSPDLSSYFLRTKFESSREPSFCSLLHYCALIVPPRCLISF